MEQGQYGFFKNAIIDGDGALLVSATSTGFTNDLSDTLAVGNTTGMNWIKPSPLFGLLSEEDMYSYTIKFDPAGYDGGTTFISTYTGGEISTFTQTPTNINLDCYDGVSLKSGANVIDASGVINSIYTSSSDILLSSSDILSTITDTITLDPGLSLGVPRTGIKSVNSTGDYSETTYTPTGINSTSSGDYNSINFSTASAYYNSSNGISISSNISLGSVNTVSGYGSNLNIFVDSIINTVNDGLVETILLLGINSGILKITDNTIANTTQILGTKTELNIVSSKILLGKPTGSLNLIMKSLPITDPHIVDAIYRDGDFLKVSNG